MLFMIANDRLCEYMFIQDLRPSPNWTAVTSENNTKTRNSPGIAFDMGLRDTIVHSFSYEAEPEPPHSAVRYTRQHLQVRLCTA
jgi:hypothetical protein